MFYRWDAEFAEIFILNPKLRWGGVDDPACVHNHRLKSFNLGAFVEGALPSLPASLHLHIHVHE